MTQCMPYKNDGNNRLTQCRSDSDDSNTKITQCTHVGQIVMSVILG